jgi:enoyl-CoA hydratase/carnithine racemase
VKLARDGDVFVLAMTDGENRMHDDFVAEWNEHIDEVGASRGPAALVTVGAGKHYSNGLDLDRLLASDPEDARLFFRALFASWARLLTLPMVTVAAVNGHAFGAGALLSLAHDRRVMRAERGWWCMPEAEHGWHLQPAMTGLLRRRLSPATAHEVIVLARRYTGPEALAAGIVDAVAPGDHAVADAVALAAPHAAKRHDALALLKHDLYADAIDLLTTERGVL